MNDNISNNNNEIKQQASNKEHNAKYQKDNITITITLPRKHLALLKDYFEAEGITKQSTFIRSIVVQFMKSKGLL